MANQGRFASGGSWNWRIFSVTFVTFHLFHQRLGSGLQLTAMFTPYANFSAPESLELQMQIRARHSLCFDLFWVNLPAYPLKNMPVARLSRNTTSHPFALHGVQFEFAPISGNMNVETFDEAVRVF
eukprot:s3438_g10.t1